MAKFEILTTYPLIYFHKTIYPFFVREGDMSWEKLSFHTCHYSNYTSFLNAISTRGSLGGYFKNEPYTHA